MSNLVVWLQAMTESSSRGGVITRGRVMLPGRRNRPSPRINQLASVRGRQFWRSAAGQNVASEDSGQEGRDFG